MKLLFKIFPLLLITLDLFAAGGDPPPPTAPGENLPIPGIAIVLIAALGYGVWKKVKETK